VTHQVQESSLTFSYASYGGSGSPHNNLYTDDPHCEAARLAFRFGRRFIGLDGEAGVTMLVESFSAMAGFKGRKAFRTPSADWDSSCDESVSDVPDEDDVSDQSHSGLTSDPASDCDLFLRHPESASEPASDCEPFLRHSNTPRPRFL
jgi:hypothetical protein